MLVPILFPWTGINCEHQDINIKTGQVRYTRSLWYITISERIEDTVLSQAIKGKIIDAADIKSWHRVNTYSPYLKYSPHYIFHSAFAQVNQIKQFASIAKLTPARKQQIAKEILTAWQKSGNDTGADDIVSSIQEKAIINQHINGIISTLKNRKKWKVHTVKIPLLQPCFTIYTDSGSIDIWDKNKNDFDTAMIRFNKGQFLYAISQKEMSSITK